MDERLMQFIRVCNALMRSDRDCATRGLAARHFSVLALGSRMGLIQWVDGTTPLFGMYKQWQRRCAERAAVVGATAAATAVRPVDRFYALLTPALEVLAPENSSCWVRVSVLCSLVPQDLVVRWILI